MKLEAIRKFRKRHNILTGLLHKNPVFALGLGLPFAIGASTSLKNGVAMSIQMLFIQLAVIFALWVLRRKVQLEPVFEVIFYAGIASIAMVLTRPLVIALFPDIQNTLGTYIALMSANSLTLYQAHTMPHKQRLSAAMAQAMKYALGFAFAVILISIVRELLGNGTLWGYAVMRSARLKGFLTPSSGFIITGMLVALCQFLHRRITAVVLLVSQRK